MKLYNNLHKNLINKKYYTTNKNEQDNSNKGFISQDWVVNLNGIFREDKTPFSVDHTFNVNDPLVSLYNFVGSWRDIYIEKYLNPELHNTVNANRIYTIRALIARTDLFRLRLFFTHSVLCMQNGRWKTLNLKFDLLLESLKKSKILLNFSKQQPSKMLHLRFTSTIKKLKKELIAHEEIMKQLTMLYIQHFNLVYDPFVEQKPVINKVLKSLASYRPAGIHPDAYYFWAVVLMGDHVPMFQKPHQIAHWRIYISEVRLLLHFMLLDNNLPSPENLMPPVLEKGNIMNKSLSEFLSQPCSDTTFSAFTKTANVVIPGLYLYTLKCIYNATILSNSKPV